MLLQLHYCLLLSFLSHAFTSSEAIAGNKAACPWPYEDFSSSRTMTAPVGANATLEINVCQENQGRCRVYLYVNEDNVATVCPANDHKEYWTTVNLSFNSTFLDNASSLELGWICNSSKYLHIFIRSNAPANLRLSVSETGMNTHDASEIHAPINFHYCGLLLNRNVQVLPRDGKFPDEGNFSCTNGSTLFRHGEKLNERSTVCTCDARWEHENVTECWSAPKVTLKYRNNSLHFREHEEVTFTCDLEIGFPISTDVNLCISNVSCYEMVVTNQTKSFNYTVTMEPEFNGLSIRCNATNDYSLTMNEAVFSNKEVLNVTFQPRIIDVYAQCESQSEGTLTVKLISNPPCTALEFFGNNSYHPLNNMPIDSSSTYGVPTRRFVYTFSKANAGELVNFTCVNHESLSGYDMQNLTASCELRQSTPMTVSVVETTLANTGEGSTTSGSDATTSTSSATESPELPLTTWAGIAAGMTIVLLLCIVLLVLIVRKRKKKAASTINSSSANLAFSGTTFGSEGKENPSHQECVNVLYGTSDDLKSGTVSGGKEEVDNVLYGTTTSPKSGGSKSPKQSAELYTFVEKVKKPKDDRNQTSTSGMQSNDTYAEIQPVEKKKNRKKGNAKKKHEKSRLSGSSQQDADVKEPAEESIGKPDTSGLVQEATYAEIDKKNKPEKDDSHDADLHGTSGD